MLSVARLDSGFSLEVDSIAPDKSISHRCAIFSLLSDKPSIIRNYLKGEDTLHSLAIAQHLGLKVENLDSNTMRFTPPKHIAEPNCVLDCGNAGTGMRLYAGLLSGVSGFFVLSGDEYLCARPMNRIIKPLSAIGAEIHARANGLAPLGIIGRQLKGFDYTSPIASAQVKSAMILAALHASEPSVYRENELSRDHTERMLRGMGARLQVDFGVLDSGVDSRVLDSGAESSKKSGVLDSGANFGKIDSRANKIDSSAPNSAALQIRINPLESKLDPLDFSIPADPSSAFYFALAAAIIPESEVLLKGVLLNPTRIEAFKVLKDMGAKVEIHTKQSAYEEIGDIYVAHDKLRAVVVEERISWLIDELPALGIAFACAEGISEVKNAKELRVKETDRISALLENLRVLGIECEEKEDGYTIKGGEFSSGVVKSFGDHRMAMSFAIAGLKCGVKIEDEQCIAVSFPNFIEILGEIAKVGVDFKPLDA
ncbi:3-phosphoshikimate 1-carboxyvinyltransferase [Helicobacter sp. CLO-3]|uniref:3-phosphoshikimate 1-carboxyvinyltransferase n=1 Tax=unclassified Helicobacter TaxID=2593540 RepID=UPI0008059F21|nr:MULTISPECIES: 3-phosphoshikimate 1-carboxyvinyltransferase [unclassified Helicobacter]OBV29756.1 3-phosphoshikimate 1-carboxyvinyltransferase [Helicobacter sp. CLO-3]OHU85209.1 3-phosphoshikimate 1-carboxyvinyltransferase [Helicobacter sp. CLO-3]